MPEGAGGPEFAPKVSPGEGPTSAPDRSLLTPLEKAIEAGIVPPGVAEFVRRATLDAGDVPRAEPGKRETLISPTGETVTIDPEHAMSEDPAAVVEAAARKLKDPKAPTGMLDPEYLRGVGPGHPDWDSLTPEQREMSDRLRRAAGGGDPPDPPEPPAEPPELPPAPPLPPPAPEAAPPPEVRESLQSIDREILETVRRLGDFEERDNAYRISTEGRRELGRLQARLRGAYQRRLDRVEREAGVRLGAMEEADAQLFEAMEALGAGGAEQRRALEELLQNARIPEGERHAQYERDLASLTPAQVEAERERLAEELDMEPDVRARIAANRAAQAAQAEALSDARGEDEDVIAAIREEMRSLEAAIGADNELLTSLDTSRKQLNSIRYQQAVARIEAIDDSDAGPGSPQEKALKRFWDAEKRYDEIVAERVFDQERAAGGAFDTSTSLQDARDAYERSLGVNRAEEARNKAVIESYFREADRRGYFDDLKAEVIRIIDAHRSPYDRGRPISVASVSEEAARDIAAFLQSVDAVRLIEGIVARRVEQGVATRGDHADIDRFAGLTQLWIDRVTTTVTDMGQNRNPRKVFSSEFGIVSGGEGWSFSEAGYVMLDRDMTTVEDYERCILSFANFLISGAIDRDPAKLFQEMQAFERIFSQSVVKNLEAPPGISREDYAKRWRLTLKGVVTFWAADYFGSLANTPNVQAVLAEAFKGDEGVELVPQSMRAYDGLAGLAMRKIERQRRYRRPLHQYFGENGGLAFEGNRDAAAEADPRARDLRTGSLEYLVRSKTEDLLAEDIMVYQLSDKPSGRMHYGRGGEAVRLRNMNELGLYQTSDSFQGRFVVDERVLAVRDKVRAEGIGSLSKEELILYKEKLARAKQAVEFARKMSGALGERAKNAAPAYIVKVYKRNERGELVNEHGEALRKEEPKGWWARGRERFLAPVHKAKAVLHRIRTGREEHHHKHKYVNGEPVLERVDYLDKNYSIRFMQFAENAAWIIAAQENKRRIAEGRRPLTAYEITKKAHEMRRRARSQLFAKGYGARLVDENGYPIYFQIRDGQRIVGGDYQDGVRVDVDTGTSFRAEAEQELIARGVLERRRRKGKQVLEGRPAVLVRERAAELAAGAGIGTVESFMGEAQALLIERGLIKVEGGKLMLNVGVAVSERAQQLAEEKGYAALDFDEITTHVLSQSCKEIYLSLQQEIRSQLLRSSTREGALRIRRGVSRPEEEDVICSMLLQIDPTLTRLRATNDDANIELIGAQVYGSFWSHFRIIRELDRQAIDEETGRQEVYYGVPNERFAWKELLWSSNKLSREAKRYGRRGWLFFANSPVHAMSFAERFGTDISASLGIMSRSDYLARQTEMEVTDSNVLADIVDRIGKSYEVLVRFAKGGTLGQEQVTPLCLKPFDNLDAAETQHIERSVSMRSLIIRIYQDLQKNLGRCEKVIRAVEAQDNPVATSGAMFLETADVRYVTEDGRTYEPTDLDIRFVDRVTGEAIEPDRPEVPSEGIYDRAEVLIRRHDGTASAGHGKRIDTEGYVVDKKRKRKKVYGLFGFEMADPSWKDITSVDTTTATGSGALMAEEWFESTFIPYAESLGREQYAAQAWVIDYMGKHIGVGELDTFWKWFASKVIRAGGPSQ